MGNPVLPVIISSPAIVTWNGKSYYTRSGITSQLNRETFMIETDTDGKIDERMKYQSTEVSFQPDGQIIGAGLSGYFPYPITTVGKSLFTGLTGSNLPLVVATKYGGASNTGQTITYPRAAMTKLPTLRLRPTDTLFGDMTFLATGVPTVLQNDAAAWNTLVDSAFGDNSFDDTKIVTDFYKAAYGSSPYNAMGGMQGFEVSINLESENIMADDFGIAETILKSITASATFAPSNLTEAQVNTLMNAQGTNVTWPGQSLSKLNTDLVIAGSGNNGLTLTVTIFKAGPKNAGFVYSDAKHRFSNVSFTSKRTWTGGVANPLYSIALT